MVRSRRRALGGRNDGPMQGHRSQSAALFGEPSLHLVEPPLEFGVFHGDRPCVGSGHQARAVRDRLVRPPLALRLHDTAGPHCCRTPDLYFGMVACVTRTRCVPGPYLRATSKCVTNLAHSELPVHARSGFRAGGFRLRRELAQAWRESGRPLPPSHSPNILFIVLDTVRADRLSLYGYERPSTPNLERFSKRGIRFDNARATAPWTLASHASMFTGRWPHEIRCSG